MDDAVPVLATNALWVKVAVALFSFDSGWRSISNLAFNSLGIGALGYRDTLGLKRGF